MVFRNESDFEEAMIKALQAKGWGDYPVLTCPTEQDLLDNWARILFENNRQKDRLGDAPLTSTEMDQIIEQVTKLRTPLKLNGFINGKTVSIKRDNPDDPSHLGKEVSLKIYDRQEIAAGQSRYQIAQQPIFKTSSAMLGERRGDLVLLINGMPVIHIELKRSGIPVSKAYDQIERYAKSGVYNGIYAVVQIFVASTPEETVYFANPGPDGTFNRDYFFHWADFNNEPINDWKSVVSDLLAIPMAHQLIGFYTVADDTDGVLKVMRSYQYYAATQISNKVAKNDWCKNNQRGGFVWHTTGSGKTMTSFKSAQLISSSKDADKVVFLMDRIELGTQSLAEYRGFAEDNEDVQATENTYVLIEKMKSDDPRDTLIVTSIQKMKNVSDDFGLRSKDLEDIQSKRIVFVVDEAHRSTFGDMLATIKQTFPRAIFFGFTGTPIHEENQKKKSTTSTIFGDELHRYSIADGIRDGNVLGFDLSRIETFPASELRKQVALDYAKAENEEDAVADPEKAKVFYHYMDAGKVPTAGKKNSDGTYTKGIEDLLPNSQYDQPKHRKAVVEDIGKNWNRLSRGGKFHALLATSSIAEAVEYYREFKKSLPNLKVTALFDPNSDEGGGAIAKEEALVEILTDYNELFGHDFVIATHAKFKRDVASRLAHKRPYERIENDPDKKLDLLIVVDQMLTGFDSKWVNTLYLDKVIRYESIIQAFSRTNRLFGPDKPFGSIRYYRKPATMQRNVDDAVALYAGTQPLALFVEHLDANLKKMNETYSDIVTLFNNAGTPDRSSLPESDAECGEFARLFSLFHNHLEAATIQGFSWDEKEYVFEESGVTISVVPDENDYLTLALRYKELRDEQPNGTSGPNLDVPYDIETHLTEIDTGRIDTDYMNSRFQKYLKALTTPGVSDEEKEALLNELHRSFAALSQEDQKFADIFIRDVQSGEAELVEGKTFRDYINDYRHTEESGKIQALVDILWLDKSRLMVLLDANVTEEKLNEFGRFDALKESVNKERAGRAFEILDGVHPGWKVGIRIDRTLSDFILKGVLPEGFEELRL